MLTVISGLDLNCCTKYGDSTIRSYRVPVPAFTRIFFLEVKVGKKVVIVIIEARASLTGHRASFFQDDVLTILLGYGLDICSSE